MGSEVEAILDALKSGRFVLSIHAAARMRLRAVTAADIRACARTARSCLYQARQRTWRVEGDDVDGNSLTVICGIGNVVVIVTIF